MAKESSDVCCTIAGKRCGTIEVGEGEQGRVVGNEYGNAGHDGKLTACDTSCVDAFDESIVDAFDSAVVVAYDRAVVNVHSSCVTVVLVGGDSTYEVKYDQKRRGAFVRFFEIAASRGKRT